MSGERTGVGMSLSGESIGVSDEALAGAVRSSVCDSWEIWVGVSGTTLAPLLRAFLGEDEGEDWRFEGEVGETWIE